MSRLSISLLAAVLLLAPSAGRAESFKYPEAKHGKGELKYINGLPVLTVAGSPEEIGEQIGVLAVKPGAGIIGSLKRLLKELDLEKALPVLTLSGKGLYKRFPVDYRKEVEAMARASGVELNMLVLANTIFDLQKIAGCSTLTVSAERSATGEPLVGRNFDFHPLGNLHDFSLVIVYRPTGKRTFALVTFPGLLAGGTGINDAGLFLAANEMIEAKDNSPKFNPVGLSTVVGIRRLIEECASVTEVEKLVRSIQPACMCGLTVADSKSFAVLEITTKSVEVRLPEHGIGICTNHFRTKALAVDTTCRRYEALEKARALPKLGLKDIAKKLHEANQGEATMHTMIFEPATLKLHLSLGKGPTSARPLKLLELAGLLGKNKDG